MSTITPHQKCIRRYVKLTSGIEDVILIVSGEHGRQWSVTIQKNNRSSTCRFIDSNAALNEFNKLRNIYRTNGSVRLFV